MKIGYNPTGLPQGDPTPDDVEQYVGDVWDLQFDVLGLVTESSRYSLVSTDGEYEVQLSGRHRIGVLDPNASAWVSTRRVVAVRTHKWSVEPGSEYLQVLISARS